MTWEILIALAILAIGIISAMAWEPEKPTWRDKISDLNDWEK